ncbi:hypothetical protein ACLKMH_18440 [Psychromonas sp. KJ10-10]
MLPKKSLTVIKLLLFSLLVATLNACDSSNAVETNEVIKPVKLYEIPTL